MQRRALGPLGSVSRLTLGGGGIGQVWGPTSRDEAAATLKAAVEAGIDLIDTAPMYLNCEAIFGETFQGALPGHVRITSKCDLGSPPQGEVRTRLEASVRKSLATMMLDKIGSLEAEIARHAADLAELRDQNERLSRVLQACQLLDE